MGALKFSVHGPESVQGMVLDPEPDWSFDELLSELHSLELNLNAPSVGSMPFNKTRRREISPSRHVDGREAAFVMHISDDDIEIKEGQGGEAYKRSFVAGRRFACDELYLSESDEFDDGMEFCLMDKVGLTEGALSELTQEHWVGVKEQIRNQISQLQTDLLNVSAKSKSQLVGVENYRDTRMEMDRKLDLQYQRKIAEALDNHLTAVQRDHEHKSQIEERKIRNDAASEEAKRKEKALQEEKIRQEKAKAELEARLEAEKKKAEEAKAAALEAERRKAEIKAAENVKRVAAADVAENQAKDRQNSQSGPGSDGSDRVQSAGKIVKAAEISLRLEEGRLQKYKELDQKNQSLVSASNKDFHSFELQIARRIKQITGTKENVRAKANELVKIFNDPLCPQSISIAMFVKKVVSQCENPGGNFNTTAFAFGHVIVLISSQVPHVLDLLLAEFNRACIYTVPKHIHYSEAAFESKEAYYKAIGYREEDGNVESTSSFLERTGSYMKLYGALLQTEVEGVPNIHGLKEGWSWLARFLNALPANLYTATALEAFLEMTGFALFRKYKSQFKKILNIISVNFLEALKGRRDPKLNSVVARINSYIETNRFLQEPEGRSLRSSLLSYTFVPESDYQDSYQYYQNRYF